MKFIKLSMVVFILFLAQFTHAEQLQLPTCAMWNTAPQQDKTLIVWGYGMAAANLKFIEDDAAKKGRSISRQITLISMKDAPIVSMGRVDEFCAKHPSTQLSIGFLILLNK